MNSSCPCIGLLGNKYEEEEDEGTTEWTSKIGHTQRFFQR